MPENPLDKLTDFLTGGANDPDRSTEFPSSESVKLQRYYRLLAEHYDLDLYDNLADRLAYVMESWRRQSRQEAVEGMGAAVGEEMSGKELVLDQLVDEEEIEEEE